MVDGESLPTLFEGNGTAVLPAHPALAGGRCEACGHIFFPMQEHGCEACGSTTLGPLPLTGRGYLVASARVHIHAAPGREAPFVVGSIALEDGAVVRSVLDVAPENDLRPGAIMTTRLVPETRAGRDAFDLRFAPASAEEV
jgi:uncharacterized OB-fold protein